MHDWSYLKFRWAGNKVISAFGADQLVIICGGGDRKLMLWATNRFRTMRIRAIVTMVRQSAHVTSTWSLLQRNYVIGYPISLVARAYTRRSATRTKDTKKTGKISSPMRDIFNNIHGNGHTNRQNSMHASPDMLCLRWCKLAAGICVLTQYGSGANTAVCG